METFYQKKVDVILIQCVKTLVQWLIISEKNSSNDPKSNQTFLAKMKLLRLKKFPIIKQLFIEEALMYHDKKNNWYIINEGSPDKSIVMGVSGVPEKLLNIERVKEDNIPVIKRFTGGGTVYIDENTLFTSFIGHHSIIKDSKVFPKEIMKWTEKFYLNIFKELNFSLQEDDYAFGEKKFGGNAQYITGGSIPRFVHHTSFLFHYEKDKMRDYLQLPQKRPKYRSDRPHEDFLTTLKSNGYQSIEQISNLIVEELKSKYNIEESTLEEAEGYLKYANDFGTKEIKL